MDNPRYSVVIPVYNRPQEVEELLASLVVQSRQQFEVIIVEDGSSIPSDKVVAAYSNRLPITYYTKPNSGPGPTRNFGFAHARGEYFVVFDSDCIIPPDYFKAVDEALAQHGWDAWGGPDRAHEQFTVLQRAMGYTMSSVLTTGGIRGGKKHLGWFQPRSFNMGISREVYRQTQGFRFDRFAEDIEFSIRMKNAGYKVGLIPDAFVYHKRRTTLGQFYRQVFNFGRGRVLVGRAYPTEVKLTHWFPTLFMLGMLTLLVLPFISLTLFGIGAAGLCTYLVAIFIHAALQSHSLAVAAWAVPAALMQLCGYGAGFLRERFIR